MPRSIVGAILSGIAVALVCLTACGDDGGAGANGGGEAEASTEPADAGAAVVVTDPADAAPPVAYPESKKGLGELATDLLAALEADDRPRAIRLVESFELMDYQRWFSDHFGDDLGAELAASYEPTVGRFDQLLEVLDELIEKGHDKVVIERFTSLADKDAVGFQNLALRAMKKRAPLYSVRLINPNAAAEDPTRVFHLWSFVHHDGSFRWVGKLKEVAPPDQAAAAMVDDEGRDRRELRLRELEKIDAIGP